MSTALPSRRFREAQLLIGAAIVMVLAAVLVELRGVLALASAFSEEARHAASAAARAAAAVLAPRGVTGPLGVAPGGIGIAVLEADRVRVTSGAAGPSEPAWWPWRSRLDWESHEERAAGPLALAGEPVVVAYAALPDGRAVRAVVAVEPATLVERWRALAGAMALLIAGGGGLLAWLLVSRVVAPYRELLAEAALVTTPRKGEAEDRFLVATFHDAVQRLQRSEAALRARADELAVLSEVLTRESGAGVVIADAGGIVRAGNQVAHELLGGALRAGEPLPAEIAGVDGRIELRARALELRRFPLRLPSGELQGEVVFVADRTRVEALERAVHEREGMAALGELSAGMAHELRNALATIRGYLRLLPTADGEQRGRYVTAIEGEAETLSAVLDRFLSFAQPRELRRQAVELYRLAADSAAKTRELFPHVSIEVAGDQARLVGDPLALGIALDNLVRNAAEAVEGRAGRVEVRVEASADAARLVVDDDGAGVSDEVRERLFAPFVSSKPSGGLGLALARRLARLHGGDVALEERPGGGTRFVITLPRGGEG
jgi:two-component system, NtrC family, sensor histidine kinase PilS